MSIKSYSSVAASNTSLFPENMAPSMVNDSARQVQADIRTWYTDAEWVDWGDAGISRAAATSFKITGDVTTRYLVNRRIKCYDSSTLYGLITGSTYSAPDTTITVGLDSGSLTSSLTAVALAILSPTNKSIPNTLGTKGADIASATTTDLSTATGDFVDVTGTTTITGLGTVGTGVARTVRFTGALTLTHNATSLILPGAANITTANGDIAIFRSLGSGNWVCSAYTKASGASIVSTALLDSSAIVVNAADNTKQVKISASGITTATTRTITMPDQDINLTPATAAEMKTATATDRFVTPGRARYSPSAAKAWAYFSGTGASINQAYNVSSITRNSTGNYTINFTTAFSNATFAFGGSAVNSGDNGLMRGPGLIAKATGTLQIGTYTIGTGGLFDCSMIDVIVFGDSA